MKYDENDYIPGDDYEEMQIKKHKNKAFDKRCELCKHFYYVYGCEPNCEMLNNGKKCQFKEEKK